MPRLGIFRSYSWRVIHCDDEVTYTPPTDSRIRVAVLTLSDKGSQGQREDKVVLILKNIWKKEVIVSHH